MINNHTPETFTNLMSLKYYLMHIADTVIKLNMDRNKTKVFNLNINV